MRARVAAAGALLTFACLAAVVTADAAPLPRLASATVLGDRVILTFDGDVQPGRGAWTIVVNGRAVRAARVVYAARRVQLVLPAALYGDDTLRVVGRNLRARSGARLRVVDTRPVNRSPAGCSEQLGTVIPGAASEGPTDPATFLDATRLRVLSVQVDFEDAPAQASDGPARLGSVDAWIRELSYGRASFTSADHPGVVRMPRKYVEYVKFGTWNELKPFFQDLVDRLDGAVDFRSYDALVIGTPQVIPRGQIRPAEVTLAAAGAGVVADGRELRHFVVPAQATAQNRVLVGLLRLAGLPPVLIQSGRWDTVSAASPAPGLMGMLAWHRRKLGWLRPHEARCLRSSPLELALEPTWRPGGVKMVVVPTGKSTAIVLENRQRSSLDAGHCRRGILAYEVRVDGQQPHVTVLPSDSTPDPACEPLGRAPFDFRPKDSARIRDTVTFEVLGVTGDGTYQLRVTR